MKICNKCKLEKPLDLFNKAKTTKDKLYLSCKPCHAAKNKSCREKKREHYLSKSKERYLLDHEKSKSDRREYYRRTKAQYLFRATLREKHIKLATPCWLTKDHLSQIRDLYRQASSLVHVDHIVPLRGKKVCGLHVPWNLQLIPAKENLEKSNRYED